MTSEVDAASPAPTAEAAAVPVSPTPAADAAPADAAEPAAPESEEPKACEPSVSSLAALPTTPTGPVVVPPPVGAPGTLGAVQAKTQGELDSPTAGAAVGFGVAGVPAGNQEKKQPLDLKHERLQGIVSKYATANGWGFVRSDLFEGELFFRLERVMPEFQGHPLQEEENVEFDVQAVDHGQPHAVNLKPVIGRKPHECLGQRHRGYVRRFADRWGFLNAAAFDGDLFVHRDNLLPVPEPVADGQPLLRAGQAVEFDVALDDRGRAVAKQITTRALLRPCDWIGQRLRGYIRSFQGAWGFINSDRFAGDLFVHRDSLTAPNQGAQLNIGTVVEFDVERDHHRKAGSGGYGQGVKNRLVARHVSVVPGAEAVGVAPQPQTAWATMPPPHQSAFPPPNPYGGQPPFGMAPQPPNPYGVAPLDPLNPYGTLPPQPYGAYPGASPYPPGAAMSPYGYQAPGLPPNPLDPLGAYGAPQYPYAQSPYAQLGIPGQPLPQLPYGQQPLPYGQPLPPQYGQPPLGQLPPQVYPPHAYASPQLQVPQYAQQPPIGALGGALPPLQAQQQQQQQAVLQQQQQQQQQQALQQQAPPQIGTLPAQLPPGQVPSFEQVLGGGLSHHHPMPLPQAAPLPQAPPSVPQAPGAAAEPEQPTQGLLHITMHDWEPDQPGQLFVTKGTLVNVSYRAAHGWVYAGTVQPSVESQEPTSEGWIPQAVVKRVSLCRVAVDWPAEGGGTLGVGKDEVIAVSKEAERGWVYGERIGKRPPEAGSCDGWLPKKVLDYLQA